jgi:pyruvate formate-lyase activating enzyme-like uncharacterized protein
VKLRGFVTEDFVNYKKASLFLICPYCSFKCDKEAGTKICQNSDLVKGPIMEIDTAKLVHASAGNPITHAVCFGGLEPLDSFDEVLDFIEQFRKICDEDIVIYTGYTEDEVTEKIEILKHYPNIIVKFGRFHPGEEPHFDPILGIYLASSNQYAKVIS